MEKLEIRKNKTYKGNKLKKKATKLKISGNYSTKQFSNYIQPNQNVFQNINSLLSNQTKTDSSKISYGGSISSSNSNILLNSKEKNLNSNLKNINNNERLFKISKAIPKKMKSMGSSRKSNLDGEFLKKAVKLFHKILIKENEQNVMKEKFAARNNSSTRVIGSKLIQDILNEKNKIISKRSRKSAKFLEDNNNSYNNSSTFFKFGENKNKKISSKFANKFNIKNDQFGKNKLTHISEREFLKIKSNKELNLYIKKNIMTNNNNEMKIKNLEIDDKYHNKNEIDKLKNKNFQLTTFDIETKKLEKILAEDKYQDELRNLFLCDNLYDSLDEDEFETSVKMNNIYIGPNDISGYIIDSLTLIASFLSLLYFPFFLAFSLDNYKLHIYSTTYIIYIFIEFIYLIDLFSGFFRAFYNFEEVLIVKKRYMSLNYIKNSFLFDLIEAIPFFIFLNEAKGECNKIGAYNFAFTDNLKYSLLFLKILKIFKTFKNSVVKAIVKFLNNSDFFSEWKMVLINVFVIICALHISSCYFIFLGKNKYPGWIDERLENGTNIEKYIASLYYVVTTLTTVGYGDITGNSIHERLFQIILLIVGTFSYSWLLTYISNYIKKHNEKYLIYEEKVKILEEIKINFPNSNPNSHDRIIRYLNYNKNKYKHNIKYVLDSLPSSIQNNLIIEIYKPIIKNFLFFKYFDNSDFFVKLVTSMKPILSMKDDILVNERDVIEDIIFIKKGILSL